MTEKEYEDLRSDVISKFKILYKDALAMDMCKVDKATRLRMLDDEVYQAETKAIKAGFFAENIKKINSVIAGQYFEEGKDNSMAILKALDMRYKILLEDVGMTKDESTALNIAVSYLSKEDFERLSTVEVNAGSNNGNDLGASFGVTEDTDSFEARLKKEMKEKMESQNAED